MYQLYYCRGKASLTPHMLLEELGIPFELVNVDVKNNQHKSAEYLALNPVGKIPLLTDGETVISETAAICLYLSDKNPDCNFGPLVGSPQRGEFYQWLFYLTSTLQTELMTYFMPQKYSECGKAEIREQACKNIADTLDLIDNRLRRNRQEGKGPYFLGQDCTVVDLFILMLARWTRDMPYPARARPDFGEYLPRIAYRPEVQRAFATEKIDAPFY
ncbi:glutathione S-transferase family protein [Rouxiella badensis]|uniref:glutathione S-transferase family protein n=1 Tax=Rouxiella badensis TaxID=1646377 RepID=UPI001D1413FF|nr:glutathione S-transferase family protein [Rouxiella badensis]MCC3718282.1 glutathione S-transferase family protein [Rouxiella badensis]MCC3726950.1 glutathione S-transferase family protein [Rouxiella badensis]MCC3738701.1 glutathione S-transferase family protein [Rouxiella badensis]